MLQRGTPGDAGESVALAAGAKAGAGFAGMCHAAVPCLGTEPALVSCCLSVLGDRELARSLCMKPVCAQMCFLSPLVLEMGVCLSVCLSSPNPHTELSSPKARLALDMGTFSLSMGVAEPISSILVRRRDSQGLHSPTGSRSRHLRVHPGRRRNRRTHECFVSQGWGVPSLPWGA